MPEQEAWSPRTRPHRGVHREEQGPTSGCNLVSITSFINPMEGSVEDLEGTAAVDSIADFILPVASAGDVTQLPSHGTLFRFRNTLYHLHPNSTRCQAASAHLCWRYNHLEHRQAYQMLSAWDNLSATFPTPPASFLESPRPALDFRSGRSHVPVRTYNQTRVLRSIAKRIGWNHRSESGFPTLLPVHL